MEGAFATNVTHALLASGGEEGIVRFWCEEDFASLLFDALVLSVRA